MSEVKKIFVVSDVHGHCTLLKNALVEKGFDSKNTNHLLICCGDYFDRGNENLEVLKFFEQIDNKVLLMGNHEELLLKLLNTGKVLPHNYINGTIQTLCDFFGKYSIDPLTDIIDFSGKSRMVDRVCDFISDTIDYFETKNYVFVHGWLPNSCKTFDERKSATSAEWEKARWIKWIETYDGNKPLSDKTLVCGHVPTFFSNKFDINRDNNCSDIFYGNGIIAIDAGTFDSKRINVLVIEDELL